jgi:hypothetical protein
MQKTGSTRIFCFHTEVWTAAVPDVQTAAAIQEVTACSPCVFGITVIKPGLAWRVDPGAGGWTGPGLIKDQLWQQPGQTRATRNPGDPGEPGRDPFFFFFSNVGFETH